MTVQIELQPQPQLQQQQQKATSKGIEMMTTNIGSNSDLLTKNNSFNSVADILQIEQEQQQRDATSSKVVLEASSSSSSNETIKRRGVQFGSVEVRLYNRIVGDHPDVKVGPPITFSWEYNTLPTYETIDRYEQEKSNAIASQTSTTPYRIQQYTGVRKLSSITRKNMLRNVFDVSEEEILAAEKEVQKIQASRGRSIQQSQFTSSVESNIHKFRRKVRQGFRATLSSIASIPLIVPGVVPQI